MLCYRLFPTQVHWSLHAASAVFYIVHKIAICVGFLVSVVDYFDNVRVALTLSESDIALRITNINH